MDGGSVENVGTIFNHYIHVDNRILQDEQDKLNYYSFPLPLSLTRIRTSEVVHLHPASTKSSRLCASVRQAMGLVQTVLLPETLKSLPNIYFVPISSVLQNPGFRVAAEWT